MSSIPTGASAAASSSSSSSSSNPSPMMTDDTMMRVYVPNPSKSSITEHTIPKPLLQNELDVLVRVHAVATNPIDLLCRHRVSESVRAEYALPIGFDASGIIQQIGSKVTSFKVGDSVYYAGDLYRAGSFAEFQLVDSRLIALKPAKLTHAEAAAFPMCTITAYEALHEHLKVERGKRLLIINGSGGVGSVGIQLGKLAGATVIATASRLVSIEWAKRMGADHVINHNNNIEEEFKLFGLAPVDCILIAHSVSSSQLNQLVQICAPSARISFLAAETLSAGFTNQCMAKRISISFESMSSRSRLGYEQEEQGKILYTVAKMIDLGLIKRIDRIQLNGFESINSAEEIQKRGTSVGKNVIVLV